MIFGSIFIRQVLFTVSGFVVSWSRTGVAVTRSGCVARGIKPSAPKNLVNRGGIYFLKEGSWISFFFSLRPLLMKYILLGYHLNYFGDLKHLVGTNIQNKKSGRGQTLFYTTVKCTPPPPTKLKTKNSLYAVFKIKLYLSFKKLNLALSWFNKAKSSFGLVLQC